MDGPSLFPLLICKFHPNTEKRLASSHPLCRLLSTSSTWIAVSELLPHHVNAVLDTPTADSLSQGTQSPSGSSGLSLWPEAYRCQSSPRSLNSARPSSARCQHTRVEQLGCLSQKAFPLWTPSFLNDFFRFRYIRVDCFFSKVLWVLQRHNVMYLFLLHHEDGIITL